MKAAGITNGLAVEKFYKEEINGHFFTKLIVFISDIFKQLTNVYHVLI